MQSGLKKSFDQALLSMEILNPFLTNVPISSSKHQKTEFFWCFQGVRDGNIDAYLMDIQF